MSQTDILIEKLAKRATWPASNKRLAFAIPLAAAALGSILALLILLELPFSHVPRVGWKPLLGKWAFSMLLSAGALASLYTLAHPGRRSSLLLLLSLAPLAGLGGLAMLESTGGLGRFPSDIWQRCVVAIGLLGTVCFTAGIYAARLLAPVRLRRAGFAAGLFGGGLAATAYAPFCGGSGAVYLLVFYGGPTAALAVFGWLAGPKLLRW